MLNIYTRHTPRCEHWDDRNWRRCRCPKWLRGILPNGKTIRQSANTRSWEQAERNARLLEEQNDPTQPESAFTAATIVQAVGEFLADQKARGLGPETCRKYSGLLDRAFLPWARKEKLVNVDEIQPTHLTRFRTSWGNSGSTSLSKHEKMSAFLEFCVSQGYVRENRMKRLKKPKKPDRVPTDYFRPHEFEAILAATDRYEFRGGDWEQRARQLHALTGLMRWSGLAILDAVILERKRLTKSSEGDDQIFLYRAKTGTPVYVVIPPDLADELRELTNSNPRYFFWSGNGDPRSARKAFERSYWKLFKLASIKGEDGQPKRCHPHMFRDTFAVELLLAGNPMDQVSLLLGHSSVKITEEHYAPFCKERQLQLTAAVKRVWGQSSRRSLLETRTSGNGSPTRMIQ